MNDVAKLNANIVLSAITLNTMVGRYGLSSVLSKSKADHISNVGRFFKEMKKRTEG